MVAQTTPPEPEVRPVPVGEVVWLPKWRVRGVVLKWPETGDLVEVQAGQMTLKVPTSQLEPHAHRRPSPAPLSPPSYIRHQRARSLWAQHHRFIVPVPYRILINTGQTGLWEYDVRIIRQRQRTV
jgi:hypothetical protein